MVNVHWVWEHKWDAQTRNHYCLRDLLGSEWQQEVFKLLSEQICSRLTKNIASLCDNGTQIVPELLKMTPETQCIGWRIFADVKCHLQQSCSPALLATDPSNSPCWCSENDFSANLESSTGFCVLLPFAYLSVLTKLPRMWEFSRLAHSFW